jgi:hypothetical protein
MGGRPSIIQFPYGLKKNLGKGNNGMKELWESGIEQRVIRKSNVGASGRLQSNMFPEESLEEFQEVRYPWDDGNE